MAAENADFSGFTGELFQYFFDISINNSRARYEEIKPLYRRAVRGPLLALCSALAPRMLSLDQSICVAPARCVSGAYNDLRYHPAEPLKRYCYLHFCAQAAREEDIPGFFLEGGAQGCRLGLRVYHGTTAGMRKIREAMLDAPDAFLAALPAPGRFETAGECFKRPPYPDAPESLRPWLSRKTVSLLRDMPNDALLAPDLPDALFDDFSRLSPLYHFWLSALR